MNNLEDIIQMAIASVKEVYTSHESSILLQEFELKLRRQIMQAESQVQLKPTGPLKRDGEASVTIRASPTHTYTINPPNLMGTWTTTQTDAMGVQSNIINKEILHG
jgi:hypothetical protein